MAEVVEEKTESEPTEGILDKNEGEEPEQKTEELETTAATKVTEPEPEAEEEQDEGRY